MRKWATLQTRLSSKKLNDLGIAHDDFIATIDVDLNEIVVVREDLDDSATGISATECVIYLACGDVISVDSSREQIMELIRHE